jgi:hypothetical protein
VYGSEQTAAAGDYSALVRGASAVYPRGGIWMLFAGYAAACLVLVLLVKDRSRSTSSIWSAWALRLP